MRTWFAVYAIPPRDDPRYRRGSAVLGYDVRRRAPPPPAWSAGLPELEPRWSDAGRQFGFHVTLAEAYAFDAPSRAAAEERLDAVAAELRDLLAALHPESVFELHGCRLVRWRDGTVWALRFDASRALDILQAALAARLAPHAEHSMFVDEDRAHPERYAEPYQRARMRRLLTPRGLDSWRPHATLLNPYDGPPGGPSGSDLAERLERAFAEPARWSVDRLALATRADEDERWTIRREFRLPGGERVPPDA